MNKKPLARQMSSLLGMSVMDIYKMWTGKEDSSKFVTIDIEKFIRK
jgi:hypothetical protein